MLWAWNLTGSFDVTILPFVFRVNLANKELQVLLATADPLDPLDPLDLLDPLERQEERYSRIQF